MILATHSAKEVCVMIKPEWISMLCGVAIVAMCFAFSFAEGMNMSVPASGTEVAINR